MRTEASAKKSAAAWTTLADLRRQVQKLWDRGQLLLVLAGEKDIFPLKLKLTVPGSRDLSDKFASVRDWIAQLSCNEGLYRIVWRQVNHRVLGTNDMPAEIWIDQLEDALKLIKKERAADTFTGVVDQTRLLQPELIVWLRKRPLRALKIAEDWPRLLQIVAWLREHPRPWMYTRELSLPGVHTKLIETYRSVLTELLDLVLTADQIDEKYSGITGFNRRYGFKDKPLRVRFRLLDSKVQLVDCACDQDITITTEAFAGVKLDVSKVFITENEINFLAFPQVENAMIVFGAGYGFENIAGAKWLHDKQILYWGDLDTHGFAILHQLRARFPHVRSLLMDRATLLAHNDFWVMETQQETSELGHLTTEERMLYDDLRNNRLGENVRLEQERISYDYLLEKLGVIVVD